MYSSYRKYLVDLKIQKSSIANLRESQIALLERGGKSLSHIQPEDFKFDALPAEMNGTYQGLDAGTDLPELLLIRQQLIKLKYAALILESQHVLARIAHPGLREDIESSLDHDTREFSVLSYQLGSHCEKQQELGTFYFSQDIDEILKARAKLETHVKEFVPAGQISDRFQQMAEPQLVSNLWDLRLGFAHRNLQENHMQLMMVDEKLQQALLLGKWWDEGMIRSSDDHSSEDWVNQQISIRVEYVANYLDKAEIRLEEIERFVKRGYDSGEARYGTKPFAEARLDQISKLTP